METKDMSIIKSSPIQQNKQTHSTVKVKVYYTFRGNTSTRLATFQMTMEQQFDDHDISFVTIPLKDCLWAICSSSPDMVCHDHDLSVYTANFQESGLNNKDLVWEGHGLMSWVMENQHVQQININGKFTQHTIDVLIELQPTLKWCKTEFYNALQSQDFDGFKNATSSIIPSQTPSCNCGIYAALCTQQKQQQQQKQEKQQWNEDNDRYSKRKRLTPPLTPSSTITNESPTLPPISTTTTTTSSSTNQSMTRLPPPAGIIASASLSPPSSLYRPEPILPSPESYHRRSSPPQGFLIKDDQSPPPTQHLPSHYHHPLQSEPSNRSAFTSTVYTDYSTSPSIKNHHQQHPLSPPLGSTSSNIPVIYTPSNKKRKKYPPMIMPANNKKSSTRPHQRQQQMQQVSTSVRTYYEVDRDDHGQYILPVEIDSWTVVNLGTVVYDRPAYHNQRYVYPVNYTVRKWYRSMVDAKSDTQYTCRILDNGREPKFEVTADDCPMTYSGPTPTTVWTIIVRRAFAIRNQEYGHNPVGPDFFGLRKNTIAKMIQDLPNVEKCSQYVWQTFEPARFNKPGRNRRRLDTMISGSILGGVNYSLTSGRLNTVASHQQHQLQIQQRRLSSAMGITGTIEANQTTTTSSSSSLSPSSSPLSSSSCSPPPQSSSVTETNNSNNSNSGTDRQSSIHSHHHTHHHHRSSSSYLQSPSSYHPPAPIETI